MKLSDYIAEFLAENGITHVFGYSGGAVTHMIDSIYKRNDIKFIPTYHEQAAAFAAEGYARIKNDIGVAMATSGPGATNLITGIGSAFFDSISCLYLSGQVNTYEYKGDLKIRQLGFQETDIVSIVKPITKYAVRVTEPSQIKYELEKAKYIMCTGRRGPVLLDIPMDIQRAEIAIDSLEGFNIEAKEPAKEGQIQETLRLLEQAKRPVILAGGGVRLAGAIELLAKFADEYQIPVVTSLMGKDAYDHHKENHCGMIGTYGNRYANFTVANCDLIIALGTRLDTRQTGTNVNSFAREAKLVRVDIDQNQLDYMMKQDEYLIQKDVKEFLSELLTYPTQIKAPTGWLNSVREYKRRFPSYSHKDCKGPNTIMHELSNMMSSEDIVCVDVGQNQMWASQSLSISKHQRFLTSGGMGAMGFSLPCAIGAYYANHDKGDIFVITGDGGLQMNIQEFQLLKRNHIPIKIVIMNNHSLGMIRHFQELYFSSRYCATIEDYSAPDFCKIASAYGIRNLNVKELDDFKRIKSLIGLSEPVLINVELPQQTYVYPKLSVNRPIEEQEPYLTEEEFLSNMLVKPYEDNDARKA